MPLVRAEINESPALTAYYYLSRSLRDIARTRRPSEYRGARTKGSLNSRTIRDINIKVTRGRLALWAQKQRGAAPLLPRILTSLSDTNSLCDIPLLTSHLLLKFSLAACPKTTRLVMSYGVTAVTVCTSLISILTIIVLSPSSQPDEYGVSSILVAVS